MRSLSEYAAWFTIAVDLLPHHGMRLDVGRQSSIKETTMSQMKIVDRNRIEFMVSLRWPLLFLKVFCFSTPKPVSGCL